MTFKKIIRIFIGICLCWLFFVKPINAHPLYCNALGAVSSERLADINNQILNLSTGLKNVLNQDNYRIYLTSLDINALVGTGAPNSWTGSCDKDTRIIYVKDLDITVNKDTLYHEIGHAFNNHLGGYSNNNDWNQAYQAEKRQFHVMTSVFNASEWFAECVVEYLENPAYFQMVAPRSYAIMDNLMRSVGVNNVMSSYYLPETVYTFTPVTSTSIQKNIINTDDTLAAQSAFWTDLFTVRYEE